MTNEASMMVGWIRISNATFCIGIPLFRNSRSNRLQVSETDADLCISEFVPIDDEQGFKVEYDVPPVIAKKRFFRGDPVPIPVGTQSGCVVISSNFPDEISLIADTSPAARALRSDLNTIIHNARSGFNRHREDIRTYGEFKERYEDLLTGEPISSRYWLSRLKSAWDEIINLPERHQSTVNSAIRERIRSWISRFSEKSDSDLTRRVLFLAGNELLDISEFSTLMARLVLNTKNRELISLLTSGDFLDMFLERLPGGLHQAEQEGFLDRNQVGARVSLIGWFNSRFQLGAQSGNFDHLWRLSMIVFGLDDPPAGDRDRYRDHHKTELAHLEQSARNDLGGFFKILGESDGWSKRAMMWLRRDDELKYLRRIFDGTQRHPNVDQQDVGGIGATLYSDLSMYADELSIDAFTRRASRSREPEIPEFSRSDKINRWLMDFGPETRDDAYQLLESAYGRRSKRYSSSLKREILVVAINSRFSRMPTLAIKGRKRIKAFRELIRKMHDQLPESTGHNIWRDMFESQD